MVNRFLFLVLCAALAPALPAASAEFDVEVDRDREVVHNDDGSTTVNRSYERTITNEETGATRTLEKSASTTRTEDGREFSRETKATGSHGVERTHTTEGSVVRNGDGSGSRSATSTRSVTNASGETRSRTTERQTDWERNGRGGRDWKSNTSTTNDRGETTEVDRQSRTARNESGRHTRTRSVRTAPDGSKSVRQRTSHSQRGHAGRGGGGRGRGSRR